MHQISAAILAGGINSRMNGQNKALLSVDNQTIFKKQFELLQPYFKDIFVVANHPNQYPEIETTSDIFLSAGPLAGIHAALTFAKTSYVFVFSCDMPFLSAPLIESMLDQVTKIPCDVLIPIHEGKIEPLYAIYHKCLLPKIEAMLQLKVHRIRELFLECDARYFDVPLEIDSEVAFFNVNKPEDLINAETYAKRIK